MGLSRWLGFSGCGLMLVRVTVVGINFGGCGLLLVGMKFNGYGLLLLLVVVGDGYLAMICLVGLELGF